MIQWSIHVWPSLADIRLPLHGDLHMEGEHHIRGRHPSSAGPAQPAAAAALSLCPRKPVQPARYGTILPPLCGALTPDLMSIVASPSLTLFPFISFFPKQERLVKSASMHCSVSFMNPVPPSSFFYQLLHLHLAHLSGFSSKHTVQEEEKYRELPIGGG